MSTRREIIKLIGAAPLAGSSAAGALAQAMATPAVTAALGIAGMASVGAPENIGPADKLLGRTIAGKLKELFEDQCVENDMARNYREAGLEPDIAALKSVSRAHKIMKQRERDRESNELMTRARRLIWN